MAQFASFIAGEPIQSGVPNDWTQVTGTLTTQIVADATTSGVTDRIFNTSAVTSSGDFTWNTAGSNADQEILTLFKLTGPSVNAASYVPGYARYDSGTNKGYYAAFTANGTSGGVNVNITYTGSLLFTNSFTWSTGSWYWTRLRCSGNVISIKNWALGNAEPASFNANVFDGTAASGSAAVRLSVDGTNIAFFSAASGISSAPSVPGKMTFTQF